MRGRTQWVPFDRPGTLGRALLEASQLGQQSIIVIGGYPPDEDAIKRFEALLLGPSKVGAVVQDPPSSRGKVHRPGGRDHFELAAPSVAIPAWLLARVPISTSQDDPSELVPQILSTVRRMGLRQVSDPSRFADPVATQHNSRDTSDDRYRRLNILIITGEPDPSGFVLDDRATIELIEDLSTHSLDCQLSVMTTSRLRGSRVIDRWRFSGMDVLSGTASRAGGYDAGPFSHVIMTTTGLNAATREWVDRFQPHAARVLFLPSLPKSRVDQLLPITPDEERPGLDILGETIDQKLQGLIAWADALWCQWQQDYELLRVRAGGKLVARIPPAIRTDVSASIADRRGILIAATEGHDVTAGNEDAALRVIQELIPAIRTVVPNCLTRIVSDRPTPMLRAAAGHAGAEFLEAHRLESALVESRLLLAAHGYGTGQPSVLMNCLAKGTPFVVTPSAVGSLELGSVRQRQVFESESDLITRARQLMLNDTLWTEAASNQVRFTNQTYGLAERKRALGVALARLGIATRANDSDLPELPPGRWRPRRVVQAVPLRPPEMPRPSSYRGIEPSTETGRYRLWASRFGQSSEVLHALRNDLKRLEYRPLISILVPVYNTDSAVLSEAIDSVFAQIYPNWQLCIADDSSTREETLELLGSGYTDPRIKVVRLPKSSGISAATNAALKVADGEYVTFLDHDDVLKPHALAQVVRWLNADCKLDVIYSDEDKLDGEGELYEPHIKPDWSPDQLMTQNYVCHLFVARTSLVHAVGGLRSEFDGSQDYDLILRLSERTNRIGHIPEPLYSWRAAPGSAAAEPNAKPYAIEAARRALVDALNRRGYAGQVDTTSWPGCFRTRYPIPGEPRVTIIIPTRDRVELLRRCVESILRRSTYTNYGILVVDNQSQDPETLGYLEDFGGDVIRYAERFNYARMMNLAAASVESDVLLFLNNDTEVISPDWIESMLEHAMRPEVGAVGGRLYFSDGVPQHEGILVGVGGGWAHNINHSGYWIRGDLTRNVSAVTGACTMVRSDVYCAVGGNDERLRIAYNDVDLCLRIRQAGYEIVYTPFAALYHYESATRGGYEHEDDGPLFGIRWHPKENCDPYYSSMFEVNRPFVLAI